jgi:dihydroneopterin aldolase
MTDRIRLEGMVFYGFHGVGPAERELGQRFLVDVELERDLARAGASDDIADTTNYSQVYRLVKEVVEGPPRNLLEALAQAIAGALLAHHPALDRVRVRVSKPNAPVKGAVLGNVSVEIEREPDEGRRTKDEGT